MNGIDISEHQTNGDKIKDLYPNAEIKFVNENGEDCVFVVMDGLGSTWNIKKSWWDAPYYGDKL